MEYGYEAGKKPATCQICGRIFPCSITSRRSRVVFWSDSSRDQAVPKSEDAATEDCTESHTLGEQSRNQVGTTAPTAMGPCAPSEPVLHFSGLVVTSEHAVTSSCFEYRVDCAAPHGFDTSPAHLAWSQPLVGTQSAQVGHLGIEPMSVISGFYDESPAVVQGKSCVVRTVSHGSDTDRSGGSGGKHTSKILSSGLHAVEVVDPDSLAESPDVVQGKSCGERAVSHDFDGAGSGGTCGRGTLPAYRARSQPGAGTQGAHAGYPRVVFAVEDVVPGFPAESSAVSRGVDVAMSGGSCGKGTSPAYLASSQVNGESRQKGRRKLERGLMPNEQVMADAKRAF